MPPTLLRSWVITMYGEILKCPFCESDSIIIIQYDEVKGAPISDSPIFLYRCDSCGRRLATTTLKWSNGKLAENDALIDYLNTIQKAGYDVGLGESSKRKETTLLRHRHSHVLGDVR